jgi:hypothetical protein
VTNHFAIHSVGQSLMTWLQNTYPEPLRTDHPCDFRVISSGELAAGEDFGTAVTLYLYRVTMNEHLRNAPRAARLGTDEVPLAVDLHLMLSVWTDSPLREHVILGWTMQQLHEHPVLDLSSLSPEADWQTGEYIQVIPAELSTEDLMRIWDALEPPYRLSVSYIARVVRIDPQRLPDIRRVVATRFSYEEAGR